MTSVTFTQEKAATGIVFKLTASGHAGYVQEGHDPVCAACSVLTQALAAALCERKPEEAGMIYSENAEAAEATVWFLAQSALEAECAEAMYNVALAGFRMLEESFPENVFVTGEKEKMH